MLCKRPTKKVEETVKEMGGSEFIIEEKLDGEMVKAIWRLSRLERATLRTIW